MRVVMSRWAIASPVVASLVSLGASFSAGCERNFAFLDDKLPGDAKTLDAIAPSEMEPRDTSTASPADAASEGDAAAEASIIGESSFVDARDGPTDRSATRAPFQTQQIALRGNHMCVIDSTDASVLCRGENQGGDSSTGWYPVTVSLDGTRLTGARALAAGQLFTCALANGDVMCWGTDPGTLEYSAVAHRVLSGQGSSFDRIEAGEAHVCVSDPAFCWGDNSQSQIRDLTVNDATRIREPVPMPSLAGTTLLTLGFRHSCANDGDGTLCWGLDDFRQCGNKPDQLCGFGAPCATTPIRIDLVSAAVGLGLGVSHTCAINADRTVACWGASEAGQSGSMAPVGCFNDACIVDVTDIANLNGVTRLALGSAHSCALTAEGHVYCWGSNAVGQLGYGVVGGAATRPLQVITAPETPLENVVELVASGDLTCALVASGNLLCWGIWMTDSPLRVATDVPF